VKSSPITDPLEWLLSRSSGCLSDEAVDALLLAVVGGEPVDVLVELPRGLRVLVPGEAVDWAWANILHVFCLDDYGLAWLLEEYGVPRRFLDAGAFIGLFSLRLLAEGAGEALLLEPAPRQAGLAEKNLALNNYSGKAIVRRVTLWERNTRVSLCLSSSLVNTSVEPGLAAAYGAACTRVIEAEAVTLSRLLEEKSYDLVKLDIEGAEVAVLREAAASGVLAPERAGVLVVEAHGEHRLRGVVEALRASGYRVKWRRLGDTLNQYIVWAS